MYKVFFNDRVVFLNTPVDKLLFNDGLFFEVSSKKDFPAIWSVFINDVYNRNLFLSAQSDELLQSIFISNFKLIEAAGGLVFNRQHQLLCIERWGKWDLPKGKIDKGETKERAALREVEEETGLSGVVITGFNTTTWHVYQSPYHQNRWVLKPTYWFSMYYNGNEQPVPQIKEDIVKACWFNTDELEQVKQNTYASLQSILTFE